MCFRIWEYVCYNRVFVCYNREGNGQYVAWTNQIFKSVCYTQEFIINKGKGHYYKFHSIENQKEHQKISKPALHQKSLFSWSLLPHHYIENGFLVDHYIKIDKDHYYKSSWSLLQKSEHWKDQFCLIFIFWPTMA